MSDQSPSADGAGVPRAGDVLVLTKPLGLGVAAVAAQAGAAPPALLEAATAAREASNGPAAEVVGQLGLPSATVGEDGLLGALHGMVTAGGVGAALRIDRVPVLDGILQMVSAGHVTEAAEANRERLADHVDFDERVTDEARALLFDPQAEGGLLVAVATARLTELLTGLGARGVRGLPIGQLLPQPAGRIGVVTPITRLGVSGGGSRTAKPVEDPPPQPE